MRDCRAKDEQIENPNKQLSCSTQSGMDVGNPRGIHNKNDHYLLTTLRQYACENKTRTKRNKPNNLILQLRTKNRNFSNSTAQEDKNSLRLHSTAAFLRTKEASSSSSAHQQY
jgi:hypothetical protein